MSNTVSANALTICHKGGGGQAICIVPDICKTPVGNAVVPLPYFIVSDANGLDQGSKTVKADGGNMIGIDGCRFQSCTGDEPGTAGGIISGVTRGESRFITTSPNVKIDGKGVGRLTDLMTMNKKNTIGIFLVDPVVVVVVPEQAEDIGLCELELKCEHKQRKAGRENVLQVVPDTSYELKVDPCDPSTYELKVGDVSYAHESENEGEEEDAVSVEISIEAGGKDEIKANVTYREGSGERQVRRLDGAWQSGPASFEAPTPVDISLWPLNSPPDQIVIQGKGKDGTVHNGVVEVFPSQQFTFELTTDRIKEWKVYELIKHKFEAFQDWCNQLLRNSPFSVSLELWDPEGSLSLTWGWKEGDDWQAYYQIEGKIAIDPIIGFKFAFRCSLLAVAGLYFGIPPSFSKAVGQHLVDILIGIRLNLGFGIEGGPSARYYPYYDHWEVLGSASLIAKGGIGFDITGRLGSDWIVSVTVTGSVDVSLKATGGVEVEREGVFLKGDLALEPTTLTFTTETRAFKLLSETSSLTVEFEGKDLWDGKTRIYPWGDSGGGSSGGGGH